MGLLDDAMQADNLAFFDTDGFAEAVTYTKAVTGVTRAINAVVNRDIMPEPEEENAGTKEIMLVCVANDATTGISETEMDTKDTITVAYRPGETAKAYLIGLPVSIDTGQLAFRLK